MRVRRLFPVLLMAGLMARLAHAQPVRISKTNALPVYVHYMPWFETRQTTPNHDWGLHWTMGNQNPNLIVDPATGRRQIASHYYPLIGPYASGDRDVIEYHLLLIKFSGIDGVLIDFYGRGGNDLPLLLRNTNALAAYIGQTGLKLGMVFEDQFDNALGDAQANMHYLDSAYAQRPDYIRVNGKPLVGVFGPQRYQTEANWTQILSGMSADPELLTLWYESGDAGANADGEFAWVYSDYLTGLRNFYSNRAPTLGTVAGAAYPGFDSFYAQGGWGGPTWTIPLDTGATLQATLDLTARQSARMDLLQLITWNDFGEGTMLEPTVEFGYRFLEKVQAFTGVGAGVAELQLIHQLYQLRKQYATDVGIQAALDRASSLLNSVQVPRGRHIIDSVAALVPARTFPAVQPMRIWPNPTAGKVQVDLPISTHIDRWALTDATGRHVQTGQSLKTLDMSSLSPGLYRLEAWQGERLYAARLVRR